MFAIFLTHAEARDVKTPRFRSLSEKGRTQIAEMASRFLELVGQLIPGIASGELAVGEILTSPSARCVESALLFADGIRDLMSASEIRVRDRLGIQGESPLSARDIVSVLDDTVSPVVLVCTHGDLAGALPIGATVKPVFNKGGWFKDIRPVLAVVEYERGSKWKEAKVLLCTSVVGGNWSNLLEGA
jgi:phosphohistidine phosphatase SixA